MSLIMFGKYDLRKEGKKFVSREFGDEYVKEFEDKYDALNRGIPIGGFYETAVFLDMIGTIKAECDSKNIFKRIKKALCG